MGGTPREGTRQSVLERDQRPVIPGGGPGGPGGGLSGAEDMLGGRPGGGPGGGLSDGDSINNAVSTSPFAIFESYFQSFPGYKDFYLYSSVKISCLHG